MSIQIETKTLDRRGWQRAVASDFVWTELHTPELSGVAGLIHIKKVTAPLTVVNLGRPTVIADDGYDWLSVAPEGAHWWLTTMYSPEGAPIQFYFDITRNNFIRGGGSWFEDLMLDVVLLSDGTCGLMDRDELDAALASSNITPEEHETACRAARELLEHVPERAEELRDFCRRMREELHSKLPK